MLIFLCARKKSLVEDQDINDKIIILGDIYWVFLCVCVAHHVLSLIHFALFNLCITIYS